MKPKFSIIIPTRKINDFIREGIPYHLKQSYKNFEIILVSEANEKEKFAKTKIVKVGQISPAEKRNAGVKAAKGEIIAFIDDDAFPSKDWLKIAAEDFEEKELSALGGPSLPPKDSTFFQIVSNEVYRLSSPKTGMRYGISIRQEIEDWPTCNFFVRKKVFEKAGGFESKYWGGEDSRLCFTIKNNGEKMVYNPNLAVNHYSRKDLTGHLKQTLFWAMWKGFLTKSFPKNSMKITFFAASLIVLWLLFGGIISIFSGSFAFIYAIVFGLYMVSLFIVGIRTKSVKLFLPVMFVTLLSQLIYGVGFLRGLAMGEPTQSTFNPAEKVKV
jgi:cellulose synthase/poly-beta-1,6-N-acetylglucosamine synthase-like glycosyltransferase